MKKTLLPCLLSTVCLFSAARPAPLSAGDLPSGRDSLAAMFWNIENFFDWRNDSTSVSDADFSSLGPRHWTRKRFDAKCNAIAKTILWTKSEAGRLPDVIGFAEVENAFVLKRLIRSTLLRKLDYRIVHYDSSDRRGIDVALLYRSSVLELLDSKPCHLYTDSLTIISTRDILLCRFRKRAAGTDTQKQVSDDADFAILVNHHPSKYGGTAASAARRRAAVSRLCFLSDSLAAAGTARILAFGDFNDTPKNPVYKELEPGLMPLYMTVFRRGEGTIRFDGSWELIDLAFASPIPSLIPAAPVPLSPARLSPWTGPMRILRPPFLRVHDSVHGGWKPFRTYSGPRYIGGVSDHCPVLVRFVLE